MATAAKQPPVETPKKNQVSKKENLIDSAAPSVQQIFQIIDRLSTIQIGKLRDADKILIVTKIIENGKPIDRITVKELVKFFEV